MATWVLLEDFAKTTGKSASEIYALCDEGRIAHKIEDDQYYIEAASGTQIALGYARSPVDVIPNNHDEDGEFAQNALNAIVALHDRVLEAKDETLDALRNENAFLKEGLLSMQEIYEKNQKTIAVLQEELQAVREDLEFAKRKYKLMWEQTVSEHAGKVVL